MFGQIDTILSRFRPCFSRNAAFVWFSILMVGFMVRLDHAGASSFVRWLLLEPKRHEPILHFFRANSWSLPDVLTLWAQFIASRCSPITINERWIMLGDAIKAGKEAQRMPAVKKLHQGSSDNTKPEWIRGHHFAFIGLVVGTLSKAFCTPLEGRIVEGKQSFDPDAPNKDDEDTIVTRTVKPAVEKARQLNRLCCVAIDAYFATGPAFRTARTALDAEGNPFVHIITRAKKSHLGYFDRGAKPYLKRNQVHLIDVFYSLQFFTNGEAMIRGELRSIQYFSMDLLWEPISALIRFVFIVNGKDRHILMCSDLDLSALDAINIYYYRGKIGPVRRKLHGFGDDFPFPTVEHKQMDVIAGDHEVQDAQTVALL